MSMDKVNKIMLSDDTLAYNYRGDTNIQLGVLGMVDDNLAIAKYGINSVMKNAVINSFFNTQRLTLSTDKKCGYTHW